MSWIAIPFACLAVLTTFIGGRIALRLSHNLPTVIAFTGGIVVAVALFDVLPEAINAIGNATTTATLVGVGFLAFFLVERLLVLHHRDDPEQARAHHQVGALGAAGLTIHSFIDGLGIGLAFGLDTATGILVFVAVAAHDFADGLNMVSFVLMQSGDRRRARRWLAVDALAPLAGRAGRRLGERSPSMRSATSSRSTSASSSTSARPTFIPRRTTSTRRGCGSRSRWRASR